MLLVCCNSTKPVFLQTLVRSHWRKQCRLQKSYTSSFQSAVSVPESARRFGHSCRAYFSVILRKKYNIIIFNSPYHRHCVPSSATELHNPHLLCQGPISLYQWFFKCIGNIETQLELVLQTLSLCIYIDISVLNMIACLRLSPGMLFFRFVVLRNYKCKLFINTPILSLLIKLFLKYIIV